ncbi:MAG: metalloregulator ArsR/SmtB family transcription factor [Acidobacteriota bacterium]
MGRLTVGRSTDDGPAGDGPPGDGSVTDAADRDAARSEDLVFRALADPSRRAMLDLLRRAPRTTGELADHFPFSRYATMKHLKVLRGAGLIRVERRGRERVNHLDPTPIQAIYRRWIRPFETTAADRLLRLKGLVEGAHPDDADRR